jgi:hypothetical protein
MKIEALSTGGGSPVNYPQVSAAALRSSSFNPGVEGTIPTSRCTSRLVVGSVINEDPGAGPLSFWCQLRLPASLAANAGVCGLSPSENLILSSSGSDPNSIGLGFMSGDLNLVMGNSSTHTRYALGVASLAGQVVDVVVTRSGSTLAAYVNGTPVTLAPVNAGAGVAPNATVTATWAHAEAPLSETISNSNVSTPGPVHRFVVYNRALSASEAGLLGILGVDVSDQWGSNTEIVNATTLNGGFETAGAGGADVFANWVELTTGTTTINRDTAVFASGTASLRYDVDGAGSLAQVEQVVLEVGKRYRVTATFRHNAASAIAPQITLNTGSLTFGPVAANTWVTQSAEGVASGAKLYVYRRSGFPSTSQWYDDVIVQRIGAILDLQFDQTCGSMAADRANQRDAVLFNGAGFTLPNATHGFARWVASAPAGERMGGSTAIVIPTDASVSRFIVHNINIGSGKTINIGSSSGANINNMVANVPLNGTGQITVIDPSNSTSPTGELWVSYTGTGSVQVTAIFDRF